jgi:Bacterial regulatory proteins, lacI family
VWASRHAGSPCRSAPGGSRWSARRTYDPDPPGAVWLPSVRDGPHGAGVASKSARMRPNSVRIEWQLYELDTGQWLRCPPKDESRRTIDVPVWLAGLLSDHLVRVKPTPCPCHGQTYVFRSHGSANGSARSSGPKLVDVARRAGVSIGTASAALNRPAGVPKRTVDLVASAVQELGTSRGGPRASWRPIGVVTASRRGCSSPP